MTFRNNHFQLKLELETQIKNKITQTVLFGSVLISYVLVKGALVRRQGRDIGRAKFWDATTLL